jgi:hypothetical protein
VNDVTRFFRRLRGKRAEETGETNNDGVKTGSQKQIAISEEQCSCGIYPRFLDIIAGPNIREKIISARVDLPGFALFKG